MYRIYIWLFTNSPQDTPKLSSLSLFCNQPSWSTKSDISSLSRQKGQSQKLTFSHFCYDLFNFLPLLFFFVFCFVLWRHTNKKNWKKVEANCHIVLKWPPVGPNPSRPSYARFTSCWLMSPTIIDQLTCMFKSILKYWKLYSQFLVVCYYIIVSRR